MSMSTSTSTFSRVLTLAIVATAGVLTPSIAGTPRRGTSARRDRPGCDHRVGRDRHPHHLHGERNSFLPFAVPWLGFVCPLALKSATQFDLPEPYPLDSEAYPRDRVDIQCLRLPVRREFSRHRRTGPRGLDDDEALRQHGRLGSGCHERTSLARAPFPCLDGIRERGRAQRV